MTTVFSSILNLHSNFVVSYTQVGAFYLNLVAQITVSSYTMQYN